MRIFLFIDIFGPASHLHMRIVKATLDRLANEILKG
jgi:hypothetical protein